jgi:hypothetical protein
MTSGQLGDAAALVGKALARGEGLRFSDSKNCHPEARFWPKDLRKMLQI